MDNVKDITVSGDATVKDALKVMDKGGIGIVCVVKPDFELIGIVTDGDFRRAVLNEIALHENVGAIVNKTFTYVRKGYTREEILKCFNDTVFKQIPVLENRILVDVITEEECFGIKSKKRFPQIDCPVVIMAGGKGTRLDPFTRILPKALIPIGEKAMIEIIMDEYAKYGMKDFYISVNYKSKMIKAFFEDRTSSGTIRYIHEEQPLGTAGALKALQNEITGTFFVSNCDVIIHDDYSKIYDFHKSSGCDITLVASMQHHTIPYGVCEIENGGRLRLIREKPEYDFLVNTGMYLLEPRTLDYIPANEFFHITTLITKLAERGEKVAVYPVTENAWIDTGEWGEYKKALEKLAF